MPILSVNPDSWSDQQLEALLIAAKTALDVARAQEDHQQAIILHLRCEQIDRYHREQTAARMRAGIAKEETK